VSGAAELDNDVLNERSRAWVADQRESELVALFIAVTAFAERHD
jgi:hypothetical protein